MKKQERLLTVLLAALLLLGGIPLFYSSHAEEKMTAEELKNALDYSRQGDTMTQTLSARELFSYTEGASLTEAEYLYLSESGICLPVSTTVPAESVYCEKVLGGIVVYAKEYSYVARNQKTVKWIPVEISVNGNAKEVVSPGYKAEYLGLTEGEECSVSVKYRMTPDLSKELVGSAANAGYYEGVRLTELLADYKRKREEYDRRSAEYNTVYERYLNAVSEYDTYLERYAEYEKKKAGYDEYLRLKKEYDEQCAAYAKYETSLAEYTKAVENYARACEEYTEKYAEYERDLAQYKKVADALEAFKTVFVNDGMGHVMFATLKGPTVATVLENRDQLIEYGGVSVKDINNAGSATEKLITLLTGYNVLKTEKEKFEYYKENYAEIKKQFILLFSSLESLGKNGAVKGVLKKNDKWERYCQFVSHLYVISICLDDTAILDPGWMFQKMPLESLLTDVIYIADRNCSDPSGITFPEKVPKEPVKPTLPTEPEKVKKPVKTWTSEPEEPIEPEKVEKPINPGSRSEYVGTAPSMPVLSNTEGMLVEGVKNGTVKKKTVTFKNGGIPPFYSEVTKKTTYEGMVTVRFFDYDRTLLYSSTIPRGNAVHYGGKTPSRPADETYSYTFTGFADVNGNPAKMNSVAEDTDFYAVYDAEKKLYCISFTDHFETKKVYSGYGEIPKSPLSEKSYFEDGYEYVFSGYTPAILAVTEDTGYTALYIRKGVDYLISFDVLGKKQYKTVQTDALPVPPEIPTVTFDGSYICSFVGWEPEIVPAKSDTGYTAVYEKSLFVPACDTEGGAEISIGASAYTVKLSGNTAYDVKKLFETAVEEKKGITFENGRLILTFDEKNAALLRDAARLSFYGNGEEFYVYLTAEDERDLLKSTPSVTLSFIGKGNDPIVYYCTSDSETPIETAEENGVLHFELCGSGRYRIACRYGISTEISGEGIVIPEKESGYAAELVRVREVLPAPGYKLARLVLRDELGNETPVNVGEGFVMPDGEATLCAFFEQEEYTVIFYGEDGSILKKDIYHYGDTVILPENPKKETKNKKTYTFSSWTPTVGKVTKNAEYRPVFKEGDLGKEGEYNPSPYDSDRFADVVFKYLFILTGIAVIAYRTAIVVRAKTKKRKKL